MKFLLTLILPLVLPISATVMASGWNQYRGDARRSGHSPVETVGQWEISWVYSDGAPPSPAWPPPAPKSYWQQLEDISARISEDQIFHPVIGDTLVIWASSSENCLRAVRENTGGLAWEFHVPAPVRYAPVILPDGHLVFAADDGSVYCLESATGQLVWSRRTAPSPEMIPGNGRMISRWPLRTGVLYQNNRLYTTAGIFPSQGVWLECLDPGSGESVFRRKLAIAPHGYMLASDHQLFIPTGRGTPVALSPDGVGPVREIGGLPGTFAIVDDRAIMTGPGNNGEINWNATGDNSEHLARFKGQHIALTPQLSVIADGARLSCIDRLAYRNISQSIRALTSSISQLKSQPETPERNTRLSRAGLELDQLKASLSGCRIWSVECDPVTGLATSSSHAFVGTSDGIEIRSLSDGTLIDSVMTGAPVGSLAISGGLIAASTTLGQIIGLKPASEVQNVQSEISTRQDNSAPRFPVTPTHGFGLVLLGSAAESELDSIVDLIHSRPLQWVVSATASENLMTLRQRLTETASITRTAFHLRDADDSTFPYVDDIANHIHIQGIASTPVLDQEIIRLAHPWRCDVSGQFNGLPEKKPLPKGKWTHQFANAGSTSFSGDTDFSLPVKLQWFGGPGPATMVDRHLRGPAPLSADGVMIVPGENIFIAVDALNGQELWQRRFPESQRYSMPYDAGYYCLVDGRFALADRDRVRLIDAWSGDEQAVIPLPGVPARDDARPGFSWGYLHLTPARIIGSIQDSRASRTVPSRQLISDDYNNFQPVVFSEAVFSLPIPENPDASEWIHQSPGSIANPSISSDAGAVYFVESDFRPEDGRGQLKAFLSRPTSIVSLSIDTGQPQWKTPMPESMTEITNSIFTSVHEDFLVVIGSLPRMNDTLYRVTCFNAGTGEFLWQAEHYKGLPGAFTHGEQVHHPVIMNGQVIAEPYIYNLSDGTPIVNNEDSLWTLKRPGHSCGTLTAAGQTLFFRAGNPTAMDLSRNLAGNNSGIIKLAPTRPGCWINMIPACGLLLIPEASSGCVCHFSLQTSMAFRPGIPHEKWSPDIP